MDELSSNVNDGLLRALAMHQHRIGKVFLV